MINKKNPFSSCCILIFLLSISRGARSQEQDPSYYCPNNTAYDSNSNRTYKANLDSLLATLSNASLTNSYYNFTAGPNTTSPTYGFFLCRGDVIGEACQLCVSAGVTRLTESCADRKTAIIWYHRCLLRFSDQSFFSVPDRSRPIYVYIPENVTDVARFNEVLGNSLDEIATEAANGRAGKKFAVQEKNFSSFQKLYTLAQCTPDLSTDDCDACLRDGISRIPSCCNGLRAVRIFFASCEIRYDTSKFYNSLADAPPPSPPQRPNVTSTSPTTSGGEGSGISTTVVVAIVVSAVIFLALLVLGFLFLRWRSKKRYDVIADATDRNDMSTAESLQYSMSQVQAATNNFSIHHKIGEGGFGAVYKGTLANGQEIAVKRLSRTSGQGAKEFKNEIVLVAKLQHRNLVRLLGFSFQREEMILIYEFVPNKSLDYFLFDPEKQALLDWPRRHKIVHGIARGLLYLHEDSRLKIIHRDLKASNVLLDENMIPKIADFGMAKLFGVDQSEGNTSIIAGTFGYMAPEYAMHGLFSVKSDVYSFGVLVLEIITGKRNNNFYQSDGTDDLPGYAWKKWRNGTPLALLDRAIGNAYARNEVLQCIHIGLLCVQDDIEQRPTMATVVLMLNSNSVTLPAPQPPAYFARSKTEILPTMEEGSDKSSSNKSVPVIVDDSSITEVYPR